MKYLFTGLSPAQCAVMALLLLAFITVLVYIVYRIMRYGLAAAAELFDDYLEAKSEEEELKEEWREMNQYIRDCEENGEWIQYNEL